MRPVWASPAVVVAITGAVTACAAPFARLDGVLMDSLPTPSSEAPRVQIIREGQATAGRPRMAVRKGDQLITAKDGVALLALRDGYDVIVEPGTDATVENPSIFLRIGKIIVKAVRKVTETLTINTEFTSAGVEGTIFVYEVSREQTARLAVLDGHVTVSSPNWPAVTYGPGEAGTIRAAAAPSRKERLDPATVRAIQRRIAAVENASRPVVPGLRGQTEEAARSALAAHGLVLGLVTRVVTRDVSHGTVASSRPPAGSAQRMGDRVSIAVADSGLIVPPVLGLTLTEARRALRAAGFAAPDTTSEYQPDARVGTVIGMAPSQGALVAADSRVVLTLARSTSGVAPVADSSRTSVVCTVPNLKDMTEAAAARALRAARLQLGKVQHLESGTTVSGQNPPANRRVKCSASVDITIGTVAVIR